MKGHTGFKTCRMMIVFGLTLALLAFFVPTTAAQGATITVTSAADDGTAVATNCPATEETPCRLRDAIAAAAAGDTITFAADFSGDNTIRLQSTLTLSRNVTIDGAGHTVVISGDRDSDGDG